MIPMERVFKCEGHDSDGDNNTTKDAMENRAQQLIIVNMVLREVLHLPYPLQSKASWQV